MVIRPTQKADVEAMSQIYVQTWRDTYLGMLPYDYLFEMSAPHHGQAFIKKLDNKQLISFVAEDSDRVLGFITGGLERNGDDIFRGEIFTLYVLKTFSGGESEKTWYPRWRHSSIGRVSIQCWCGCSSSIPTGGFIST